jgi:hypothetical protein
VEKLRHEAAIGTARRLQFWALPKPRGPGDPPTCRGKSVLLTSLVATAWRLSYERITDWLARYDALAESLGYDDFFVFRVYIAALIVAFITAHYQRPKLATLRLKMLAFVNT